MNLEQKIYAMLDRRRPAFHSAAGSPCAAAQPVLCPHSAVQSHQNRKTPEQAWYVINPDAFFRIPVSCSLFAPGQYLPRRPVLFFVCLINADFHTFILFFPYRFLYHFYLFQMYSMISESISFLPAYQYI